MSQLNRLYWIKKEIEQIEEQIKELSVLSAVKMSGMPKGNDVNSPVEQFTARLLLLQDKLCKKLIEYVDEQTRIEEVIENFDEPEVRIIARKRYIENKSWEAIGNEMFIDRTTAYKKLRKYEKSHL